MRKKDEREKNLEFLPSYHPALVTGVGTYALEFLTAVSGLEIVYVPIGLGSGIAGFIAAKEALGHCVEVVGVVSEKADAYASSWESRKMVSTLNANTIADGLAVREPSVEALNSYLVECSVLLGCLDDIIKRLRCCYQIPITWSNPPVLLLSRG